MIWDHETDAIREARDLYEAAVDRVERAEMELKLALEEERERLHDLEEMKLDHDDLVRKYREEERRKQEESL